MPIFDSARSGRSGVFLASAALARVREHVGRFKPQRAPRLRVRGGAGRGVRVRRSRRRQRAPGPGDCRSVL